MTRLRRDDLFIGVAELFALRSTCTRGNVGAVIVRDNHIIAHGYNGAPAGMAHCTDVGCDVPEGGVAVGNCPRCAGEGDDLSGEPCFACGGSGKQYESLGCQRIIHAEANAVAYAARVGVNCSGAEMYCTHEPCAGCAKLIIASGIAHVTFINPYRLGARSLLEKAGVGMAVVVREQA